MGLVFCCFFFVCLFATSHKKNCRKMKVLYIVFHKCINPQCTTISCGPAFRILLFVSFTNTGKPKVGRQVARSVCHLSFVAEAMLQMFLQSEGLFKLYPHIYICENYPASPRVDEVYRWNLPFQKMLQSILHYINSCSCIP